ncbi:hypothetical protein J437_LFUL008941 [Ladona fulva]|uniref:Uncharacterized protein n=1 Tax=Ladona fulva TaxID=123851 RepID=A0A8K0P5M8_LADFU|nr:hypothetical protein J437_LFUL008941 [Ladona fulva]
MMTMKQLSNNIIEAKIISGKDKALGQALTYCSINVKELYFSYGQIYVACYRGGNSKKLYIYSPNNKMTNVVYKQVL